MSENRNEVVGYYMNHFSGKSVVIGPGQYYVSQERVTISTLLGSCVAVCLWDSSTGIIGMNSLPSGQKSTLQCCEWRTERGRKVRDTGCGASH
jgi:chemotaxis receptor (MCP) glutamine deamidase CheD